MIDEKHPPAKEKMQVNQTQYIVRRGCKKSYQVNILLRNKTKKNTNFNEKHKKNVEKKHDRAIYYLYKENEKGKYKYLKKNIKLTTCS